MAEARRPQQEVEDEAEKPAKPKKSQSKLIIFAIIGIVVLALAGGGAFFLLGGNKGKGDEQTLEDTQQGDEAATGEEGDEQAATDKPNQQAIIPPVYVKLEPFTTNLAPEQGTAFSAADQYIQIVVELKVDTAASGELLKQYTPEIRNNILRLLSIKRPTELALTEGKDALANEIRDSVNGIVKPGANKDGKSPPSPVGSVLFSSFIIQ